jgi:hypothetical protein
VKTWSDTVSMPAVRGGEMARATGEVPGTEYVYRISQDLEDPESGIDVVVTSLDTGRVYTAAVDKGEWGDLGFDLWDLWDLLIARLLPSGGAVDG